MEEKIDIFVLMPFKEEFDDVYLVIQDAVRIASESTGTRLKCLRADQIDKPGRITDQIIEAIRSADLIIADLSGNNPNVMYELGFAHALGKQTVIINQGVHESPFDVKDFRQIVYDRGRLVKDCRPRLIAAVSDVFGNFERKTLTDSVEPQTPPSGAGEAGFQTPLIPGDSLAATLQQVHLKLQFANLKGDFQTLAKTARELRGYVDRITVVSVGDPQDIRVTAGVIGNCAVELEKGNLFQEAEDIFKRAIGLFPDYPGLHLQYSDFLVDRGRVDEARLELDRARELNSSDERIQRVEMKINFATGVVTDDLGHRLRDEFEREPQNPLKAAAYLLYLTRSGKSIAEFEAVCKRWQSALPEEEKWIPMRALADRLASEDDPACEARAVEIYESIVEHGEGEDRRAVLHNLGTLYGRQKKRDLAKARWLEAYRMDRNDPAIRASFSQFLASGNELELAMKVVSGEPLD